MGRFQIRMNPRILILFLILGLVPLIFGHLFLAKGAETRFKETIGSYLSQNATHLQAEVVSYLEDLEIQVANLASMPEIQSLVKAQNERLPEERTFADRIQQIEQEWPSMTSSTSPLLREILNNRAALLLRDYNQITVRFRELLVTDRYGRLVAASGKTTDYFQADEDWWRIAYLEGTGQRFISDIVFDESARVHSVEVAHPVRDTLTGEVLGIIKAIADCEGIFALLDQPRFGESILAVAIRPDGSVVTNPTGAEIYPFASDVLAAVNQGRRWLILPSNNPRVLLGLPRFGMKQRIPGLDWYVLIQAPYGEVFYPFQVLSSWFLYIVLFSVAVVIVLSVIFTWILSKPLIETDMHLERL